MRRRDQAWFQSMWQHLLPRPLAARGAAPSTAALGVFGTQPVFSGVSPLPTPVVTHGAGHQVWEEMSQCV